MVLFPFHWTTQFKYLLVAFPHSELLRRFYHSLGAPPGPGCAADGGVGAVLLSGEALPKKLCMCSARQSWQGAHLCNLLLFLLMDNSLLEMKYETFADNVPSVHGDSHLNQQKAASYLQLLSTKVIWTNYMSPLLPEYGSPASIHLHWPAM